IGNEVFLVGYVINYDGLVEAGRGDILTVWRPGESSDQVRVTATKDARRTLTEGWATRQDSDVTLPWKSRRTVRIPSTCHVHAIGRPSESGDMAGVETANIFMIARSVTDVFS